MNIQLNSKRALVTASTGGIGFAIAKGLAEAGAEVGSMAAVKARSSKQLPD